MKEQSLLSECEMAIEKLRKNRENVPLEVLKTRYAFSYGKLLEEIRDMVEELIKRLLIQGLPFHTEDIEEKDQFLEMVQAIIQEEAAGETFQKIGHAVFQEYNIFKALEIAERISDRIRREAYGSYWISNCYECNGVIYNRIINMKWDRENKLWVGNENSKFSLMLPPSKELIEHEFQK